MGSAIEVVLTIIGLSFWILFPIGMFLSVSYIEKNTDHPEEEQKKDVRRGGVYRPIPFDWHHPVHFFRQWLEH